MLMYYWIYWTCNESLTFYRFSPTYSINSHEKTCLLGFANNTGADQPVYPRSLNSAFVILFLESIMCEHATGEISIF